MNQRVILTFKSYFLRNEFCKAIAAIIVIPLMDLGKVTWKPPGNDSPFRCHQEYSWFMGRGQNIKVNGRMEKVDYNPMGDFEEFKTSL